METVHTKSSSSMTYFKGWPVFSVKSSKRNTFLLISSHKWDDTETEILGTNIENFKHAQTDNHSSNFLIFSDLEIEQVASKLFADMPPDAKMLLLLISNAATFPEEALKK